MNENTQTKRREWVKNAAIIFLTVMLLLTFFSNTIMNYSLPEVATRYVERGSITAKVRGTGNVEATDPYNVMVKETRVISGVAVKQGDKVEKDQILYYLEDAESEELKNAEEELETLELTYMKGLFGGNVSPEIINKVASGNTDNFSSYQAKVTDMQTRLLTAEKRVEECQRAVDDITLQSNIDTNNAGISTLPHELEKDIASTDLAHAEAGFNEWKAQKTAEISAEIMRLEKEIADLEVLVNHAGNSSEGVDGANPDTGKTDDLVAQREKALLLVKDKVTAIKAAAVNGSIEGAADIAIGSTLEELKANFTALLNVIDKANKTADYQTMFAEYNAALIVVENIDSTSGNLNSYAANKSKLEEKRARCQKLQVKLAEVEGITVSSNEGVSDAKKRLEEATRNITEITNANKQSSAEYQNRLANANAALKNAQAVYELLKTEQTKLSGDINAELDLAKANKDIAEKKEEISKLKEKSMGAAIKAPVAGTVTNLAYVAGETTKPEQAAAVIQVEGKGFTVSFSVTNEQARKVQVGDTAELQNAWYYEDVKAVLAAIKPDPESAGQKKMLVFNVSGPSIEAGQALNLSVGQKSAEYELVVPNSAIREDSNGKFILIVESKSSPLGNRYIATRVDVEVLAADDNNTAISAGLYGYEYVITTSTKPVEAGKQVRLNENA